MIALIYGTTGELIKLAPVMRRLQTRNVPLLSITTGQQVEQIPQMLADFDLPPPDIWLARGASGADLQRPRDLPGWFVGVLARYVRNRRRIVQQLDDAAAQRCVLVHGDTMTTVLGAMLGRLLGARVAHIEAGLRSGRWRDPFPEELSRRSTPMFARVHFAPGADAVANLQAESVRGEIVDTEYNTIIDNLRDIPPGLPPGLDLPPGPFGIVSLHRQELLYNREALTPILHLLRDSATRRTPLLFIDHSITAAAVEGAGLTDLFDGDRFRRIPRLRYFHFLSLLKASSFLVTDSGGSQEECAFLGHPCLIHRAVTERDAGLAAGPVTLSLMNLETVRDFLENPERHRTMPRIPRNSPSDRIVEFLMERGFTPRDKPDSDGQRAALKPKSAIDSSEL